MIKKRVLLFFSFLIVILFLLISNPFGLYFLSDDFVNLPESVKGNFFQAFLRPITYLSFWLDFQLWGMNPAGYHMTNLILHLGSTVLVFLLTKILLQKYAFCFSKKKYIPLFTSFLFLCFGFHSEPIFWIVSREAVLATIFIQLCLFFFLKGNPACIFLSVISFIASLFTYELSWCVPPILAIFSIYELLILKKIKAFKLHIVFWIVFMIYLWYRYQFLGYGFGYGTLNNTHHNYFILLRNFCTLVARQFIPPLKSGSLFLIFFVLISLIVFLLCFKVYRFSKNAFVYLVLIGVCMATAVLPVIALGADTHDTESERYIYLSSMFTCMFLVFLCFSLLGHSRHFYILMLLFIFSNLFFLFQSSKSYRYASSVSKHIIESLNSFPFVKEITFVNLPSQYKGALLFRIGFVKNAKGILRPEYDAVRIVCYKELMHPIPFNYVNEGVPNSATNLSVEFIDHKIIFRQK